MANVDKHPDLETMLGYIDGELAQIRLAEVAGHLAVCPDCLLETHRLRALLEIPRTDVAAGGALGQAHLETLMKGIQVWRDRAESPHRRDEIHRQIASILTPYLGASGAQSVLRPVAGNHANLLSTVEPVLAMFLGAAAASRLTERIIDSVRREEN